MILNYIWIAFFLVGFVVAFIKMLFGDTEIFSTILTQMFDSAKLGFEIALGLTGIMAFWLGMMRVGEKGGVIKVFAKLVNPFFSKLFPDIPKDNDANGSIIMNFSANMLGLDNAATPLGLKAMQDLQSINKDKAVASNAMIMFLVLNTAGITLIPTSVIAIRQTMAIEQGLVGFNAADIFLPTLIGTFISFVSGMLAVAWFQKIKILQPAILLFLLGFSGLMAALFFWLKQFPADEMSTMISLIGSVIIISIIILFIFIGFINKINVYDCFVEGAKDGFKTSVTIIPYLIAILVAIAVFRASGCLDFIVDGIAYAVNAIGLDDRFVPTLPIGLMKTVSGSGARGLMVDVMQTYGVDSFQGKLASIIQGSTETTFYVLAVYFGSVNIKETRYAVTCGLIADFVGLIGAILVGYLFFG
ncbi:MAG: spore maturation protein [Chitinophagales bacterium]|nr:spore maturation protein [Chitinophagales bacterium]